MKYLPLLSCLLILLFGQMAYAEVVRYVCEVEAHMTNHKRFQGSSDLNADTAYLYANSSCPMYNAGVDCKKITPCQRLVFNPPVKQPKVKQKKSKKQKN